jgi:hypothetical protein
MKRVLASCLNFEEENQKNSKKITIGVLAIVSSLKEDEK